VAQTSERHQSVGVVMSGWGDHLVRCGDLVAARRAFAVTLDLAVADLRGFAAHDAECRMRAAGGRPRRLRTTGPAALTPSQRTVAELARAGLTNTQIGRELWLSEKTVESHLRAAFRTLAITRRTQLSQALAE
jgi:DNA-binding NarL/FixJ family response regulator